MSKPAYTISEQIQILKDRGMLFKDERNAMEYLQNISYYRLKGYWWDMQSDYKEHTFKKNVYFEQVIRRYDFDRKLRGILFNAVEYIEISIRTKLIYHLSLKYGGLWYLEENLFDRTKNKTYQRTINKLQEEFNRSQEVFVIDHRRRHKNVSPDVWKILEVASLGTLSKLYKNLKHQLPEKSKIANEMGLNLHTELSSWLEAISYMRNIIAHHSRLWSKNMTKKPTYKLKNPRGKWFQYSDKLTEVQIKKPFLIISCMVYLCDIMNPQHSVREELLDLFKEYSDIEIYKLGFVNSWYKEQVWLK
ncbi:Abi family protein [Riemerella anatipestifer]|uniref:Abi family protein n=1 Tax=Riemerella anatipestifer TaxID=34085 RepID=UPI002A84ED6F|nr:Abi family protein [Riemerella anatipestifer]